MRLISPEAIVCQPNSCGSCYLTRYYRPTLVDVECKKASGVESCVTESNFQNKYFKSNHICVASSLFRSSACKFGKNPSFVGRLMQIQSFLCNPVFFDVKTKGSVGNITKKNLPVTVKFLCG